MSKLLGSMQAFNYLEKLADVASEMAGSKESEAIMHNKAAQILRQSYY
jgi:hypothetical protein